MSNMNLPVEIMKMILQYLTYKDGESDDCQQVLEKSERRLVASCEADQHQGYGGKLPG
jgi:hypothetical protein